jgi:hypothetical protein
MSTKIAAINASLGQKREHNYDTKKKQILESNKTDWHFIFLLQI